jgi:hypothetical protein
METIANIVVYEAKDLKNTQMIGKQSPYAALATTAAPGRVQKTRTYISGGDIAIWNELKTLPVSLSRDSLIISVMNENKSVTIGQAILSCSVLTEYPTEQWCALTDSKGLQAGHIRIGVSYANIPKQCQPIVSNIGGFSQPGQPVKSIGGFSQPAQSSAQIIGGFHQPSTQAPVHAIGGFSTVSSHSTGGTPQQYSSISGFSTTYTTPANSGGSLNGTVQPNVTVTGPYIPQTDTHHGGRALYPPVAPVVATRMVEVNAPVSCVHVASPSQLAGTANGIPSAPHSTSAAPVAVSYANAPPLAPPQQLPPGWQAMTAPDGRTYYLDHNTKTSSWTLPHY